MSELLKVSVGAVLLLFDCALLTALALCCGCPRCAAHWPAAAVAIVPRGLPRARPTGWDRLERR